MEWGTIPSPIKEYADEIFVASLIVVFILFYQETTNHNESTVRLPRLFIYAGIVGCLFWFVQRLARSRYSGYFQGGTSEEAENRLQKFSNKIGADEDINSQPDQNGGFEFKVSHQTIYYIIPFILYVYALNIIGFFTTNFIFIAGYAFVEYPGSRLEKLFWSVVSAAITIGVLYIILWEILRLARIIRMGMFL